MAEDFVIGIDSSTQMTKAVAWAHDGRALGEGHCPVAMSCPEEGYFEQDPENWWHSCCTALAGLGRHVNLHHAAGLAISNQRETVGLFDAQGRAVRPAMVWLDERATETMHDVAREFGGEKIHQITGKPFDVTPVLYRLHWMRRFEPERLDGAASILDVHAFLIWRLTGTAKASWTSADPFGVFDIEERNWSAAILRYLGISAGKFPPAIRPGTLSGKVSKQAAAATGLAAGLPVIAAGGDGQCAGLGSNAVRSGAVYLNLGTAIITGAFAATPSISQSWRTMTSPSGEGYFLEGVLRAGTFFVDWCVRNIMRQPATTVTFSELTEAAGQIAVGSDGLCVSPYLSGCMNPHWSMDARAAFFGLSPAHGPAHLYRAVLESLTCEIARCIADMEACNIPVQTIVAVGGGANSPLWLQMIADATGRAVHVSDSHEASSLGAAMSAAVGIGWYADFASAAAAMNSAHPAKMPGQDGRSSAWPALLERQDRLNRIVIAEGKALRMAQSKNPGT